MSIVVIVILAVVVLFIIWWIGTYNRLVSLKQNVQSSWSQIDVQLKKRHDLVPNLVETVKGYAAHERGTFDEVTKARQMAVDATGAADKIQAENMLTQTLRSLFAVAEAYPDLKASQNFQMLQEELSGIESKIAYARQHYNDVSQEYNTLRLQFPASIVAGMGNFPEQSYFDIPQGEEAVPQVKF